MPVPVLLGIKTLLPGPRAKSGTLNTDTELEYVGTVNVAAKVLAVLLAAPSSAPPKLSLAPARTL